MALVKLSSLQAAAKAAAPHIPNVQHFGLIHGFGSGDIPPLRIEHEWGGEGKPIPPRIIQELNKCLMGRPLIIPYMLYHFLVVLLEFAPGSPVLKSNGDDDGERLEDLELRFSVVKMVRADAVEIDV